MILKKGISSLLLEHKALLHEGGDFAVDLSSWYHAGSEPGELSGKTPATDPRLASNRVLHEHNPASVCGSYGLT